jgi:hypothetical protein
MKKQAIARRDLTISLKVYRFIRLQRIKLLFEIIKSLKIEQLPVA